MPISSYSLPIFVIVKRFLTSSFLLFSFSLALAHGMIPHDHQPIENDEHTIHQNEHHHHGAHHHHHHDKQEEEKKETNESIPFPYHLHLFDSTDFKSNRSVVNNFFKNHLLKDYTADADLLLAFNIQVKFYNIWPKTKSLFLKTCGHYPGNVALRAPPSLG